MIQNCEPKADSVRAIDSFIKRMLDLDPEFVDVYYLGYLNSLRTNHYTDAQYFVHMSIAPNNEAEARMLFQQKHEILEELNKGFR